MRTKNKMQLWLRDYERSRHSKRPNESWISSRYDIQGMHWQELQQLYLPELNMRWGPAVSALKKLWKSYKIAGISNTNLSFRVIDSYGRQCWILICLWHMVQYW